MPQNRNHPVTRKTRPKSLGVSIVHTFAPAAPLPHRLAGLRLPCQLYTAVVVSAASPVSRGMAALGNGVISPDLRIVVPPPPPARAVLQGPASPRAAAVSTAAERPRSWLRSSALSRVQMLPLTVCVRRGGKAIGVGTTRLPSRPVRNTPLCIQRRLTCLVGSHPCLLPSGPCTSRAPGRNWSPVNGTGVACIAPGSRCPSSRRYRNRVADVAVVAP